MPEVKPGNETTEFTIAKFGAVTGLILDAVAVSLATLQEHGIDKPWLAVTLAVCGTLLKILSALGYYKSRTELKKAAINAAVTAGDNARGTVRNLDDAAKALSTSVSK